MKAITDFIKREAVLVIASVLAVISAFIIPPDKEYLGYIDWRTLGILFCLMAVVAGLKEQGLFRLLAERMLDKVRTIRQLVFVLVGLCFFLSMLVTNDVALITFVPLTFIMLELAGADTLGKWLLPTVAMQTIAANLGSMLTPFGNPQNLYLYSLSGISPVDFVLILLPYCALSGVLLAVWIIVGSWKRNDPVTVSLAERTQLKSRRIPLVYGALFLLSLLSVLRVVDYRITLGVVLLAVVIMDRATLKKVDYSLLVTFVAFFVFIGNMGRLPLFREAISGVIGGAEVLTSVVSSQVISNVPAALLLSEFTAEYSALLIGTNLGGLGTLIASMASLISFKLLAAKYPEKKGKYMAWFTISNVAFLAVLLGLYFLIRAL